MCHQESYNNNTLKVSVILKHTLVILERQTINMKKVENNGAKRSKNMATSFNTSATRLGKKNQYHIMVAVLGCPLTAIAWHYSPNQFYIVQQLTHYDIVIVKHAIEFRHPLLQANNIRPIIPKPSEK